MHEPGAHSSICPINVNRPAAGNVRKSGAVAGGRERALRDGSRAMPPRKKKNAPAPLLVDSTAEKSVEPPEPKEPRQVPSRPEWRKEQPSRMKRWHQLVDEMLLGAGFESQEIEGRGDCAFIAMMAGDDREIPIGKVRRLNDNERDVYVTKRRKTLVDCFMTEVVGNKAEAWLTREELLNVATMLELKMPAGRVALVGSTQMPVVYTDSQLRTIKQAMRRKLANWKQPLFYGKGHYMEVVMMAFGWMLQRNVLQLSPVGNSDLGALAFESAARLSREHHACLVLSGARVTSLRGKSGRPVFPHVLAALESSVHLLRDDLEDTVLHGRVDPEIRAYRASAMRLPAWTCVAHARLSAFLPTLLRVRVAQPKAGSATRPGPKIC